MLKAKNKLIGKISSKSNLKGKLNNAVKYIYPDLENLEIEPSKQAQVFNHEGFYGYDEVTVKSIPDKYIIPDGTLEITTNGEHNVKDYEKVLADIHEVSKYAPRHISFYGYSGTELNEEIANLSLENITSVKNMFYSVSTLKELNLSSLDFSTITSFYNMCYGCRDLTKIDFGNSVPKPTDLSAMCYNCRSLTSLNISHFDGSEVTSISSMCWANHALKTFSLPSNLGENVRTVSFSDAFYSCQALEELDLSYLRCATATMSKMFQGCTSLRRVDLRNITGYFSPNVNNMFNNCTLLEYVDIRSLDMSAATSNYSTMLTNVPTTCEIIVKDDANKQWFNEKFPTYTNVKTVAELEATM